MVLVDLLKVTHCFRPFFCVVWIHLKLLLDNHVYEISFSECIFLCKYILTFCWQIISI